VTTVEVTWTEKTANTDTDEQLPPLHNERFNHLAGWNFEPFCIIGSRRVPPKSNLFKKSAGYETRPGYHMSGRTGSESEFALAFFCWFRSPCGECISSDAMSTIPGGSKLHVGDAIITSTLSGGFVPPHYWIGK
jgi:hypothetical protein